MVKRPLTWLLFAFMFGIACNKYICSISEIIPIFLLFFLFCVLFYHFFKLKCNVFSKQDSFIFLLPFLFFFGYATAYYHGSQEVLKLEERETIQADFVGVVSNVILKNTYQEVYLSSVQIQKEDSSIVTVNQIVYQDKAFSSLCKGDVLRGMGTLSRYDAARNPGNYDERSAYQAKNIYYKVRNGTLISVSHTKNIVYIGLKKLKDRVAHTYSSVLSESDSGILHAMVLGDKSELDSDIKTLYQKAGISHILAISGLHISMIGMLLFGLLKKAGLHHNLASVFCIVLIYLYGILTGFSVSTNRAVLMMMLSLSGCLIGRTYDSISAICFSGFVILVQQPFQLFQCGFLLSFLAVTGAVWFYPVVKEYITVKFSHMDERMKVRKQMQYYSISVFGYQVFRKFIDAFIVSLSIQIVTLPVLMWYYYEFSILSPIVNLLILPLTTLLMILALLIAFLGSFIPIVGVFFGGSVHFILLFYQMVCTVFQNISFNMLITGRPLYIQIVLYYCILLVFIVCMKRGTGRFHLLLPLLALLIILIKIPENEMEATFLDVGQGDCMFFETKDGFTLLVDGGSTDTSSVGQYRIQPFLLYKGIKQIDYIILTHMDADHINGIKELLEFSKEPGSIQINTLLLPNTSFADEGLVEMRSLAESAGVKVRYIDRGDELNTGNLKITCLHPYYEFVADTANDYSTVLEVSYQNFHMLMTGDVGLSGEQGILDTNALHFDKYDVLKVAHHGSKYNSSKEWITRIAPKYSIISAGYENSYGHPHAETLELLAESQILQTMDCGAITMSYKLGKITTELFR